MKLSTNFGQIIFARGESRNQERKSRIERLVFYLFIYFFQFYLLINVHSVGQT